MDELENMLQSGMIDFKTYEDLRKKLDPNYKQDYERARESVAAAQEFVQQEKSRGLGSVNIGGDVNQNIYMSP